MVVLASTVLALLDKDTMADNEFQLSIPNDGECKYIVNIASSKVHCVGHDLNRTVCGWRFDHSQYASVEDGEDRVWRQLCEKCLPVKRKS